MFRTRVSRRVIQVIPPLLTFNIPLVKSCCCFGVFYPFPSAAEVLRVGEGRGRVWLRKIYLCLHSAKPAHSKHVPPPMRSAGVWLCSCLPSLPQPYAKAHQLQELFLILAIRFWLQAPTIFCLSPGLRTLLLVHLLHAWELPEFSVVGDLSFPGLAEREDVWEAGNEWGELEDMGLTLSGKYNRSV